MGNTGIQNYFIMQDTCWRRPLIYKVEKVGQNVIILLK